MNESHEQAVKNANTGWTKYSFLSCPHCSSDQGKYKIYVNKNKDGQIQKLTFKCLKCRYEAEVFNYDGTTREERIIQIRSTDALRDYYHSLDRQGEGYRYTETYRRIQQRRTDRVEDDVERSED